MILPTVVTIKPRSVSGDTVDTTIYMQRRGVSVRREYGNSEHGFYVVQNPNGDVSVAFHKDDWRPRPSESKTFAEAEIIIANETGVTFKFAPETMAYCYSSKGVGIEENDLFFSPLWYCEYSDTVRHWSNICVVAFKDGQFKQPDFDVDRASAPFQAAIQRALKVGFHQCDAAMGDDYCKRRLAWLAGTFLIEEAPATGIQVGVYGRDMSSMPRLIRLT